MYPFPPNGLEDLYAIRSGYVCGTRLASPAGIRNKARQTATASRGRPSTPPTLKVEARRTQLPKVRHRTCLSQNSMGRSCTGKSNAVRRNPICDVGDFVGYALLWLDLMIVELNRYRGGALVEVGLS